MLVFEEEGKREPTTNKINVLNKFLCFGVLKWQIFSTRFLNHKVNFYCNS